MCLRQQSRNLEPPDIVYEDDYWLIRHSTETNILGYVVVEAKRHYLDLSECNAEEAVTYGQLLSTLMAAIHGVIDCQRIYTFTLAEVVPHFHVHVVPRTQSIPRVYRGRGIMSYPTKPKADATLVEEVCSRLRRALRQQLRMRADNITC